MVVTGAGSGLGRAYALLLAQLGGSVVVNDLGTSAAGIGASKAAADAVVEEIKQAGGIAVASTDSVATAAGGKAIIETALDSFGRIDALINNAGTLRTGSFEDVSDANLDAMIDVHLKGAFHVTRPAFRAMKAQKYGRLLFTASSAGLLGAEGGSAYGSAKSGLIGLMNVTAIEGAPHGILSNLLMPASTTRMVSEGVTSYLERIGVAIGSMGADQLRAMGPEYVAPLAVYLISEQCSSTHAIYSAVFGRYARVFLGMGAGWFGPTAQPASLEDVAANFANIDATMPFTLPAHLAEEFEEMARTLTLGGKK